MKLFLVGLCVLLFGASVYGRLVEAIFRPDNRNVPAKKDFDGVDFLVLPDWKNKLIQLLNIAGIGPVIGVIIGIKFGTIVFLIIPVGCVLMGAVHDLTAGLISMRHDGANLPKLVYLATNKRIYFLFSVFMTLTLLLVVAVFINVPAQLVAGLLPSDHSLFWAVVAIFLYYVCATLFPVDKIIGKIYPFFGALLLIGTGALFISLIINGFRDPALLVAGKAFQEQMFSGEKGMPIFPMLFVTIACGILSGFHATQAPIVARTMDSEKRARGVFFNMMITEGFIAMVWAAGALAIYNRFPEMMSLAPMKVLSQITSHFLNSHISLLVICSVIILAITSGDTALRSLRISLADAFHVNQKPFWSRILLTLPLMVIVTFLLFWSSRNAQSFNLLWNYFAWSNQILAVFTFLVGTVYLVSIDRSPAITLVPGIFITFIVIEYILWINGENNAPAGLGLDELCARIAASFFALLIFIWAIGKGKTMRGKLQR